MNPEMQKNPSKPTIPFNEYIVYAIRNQRPLGACAVNNNILKEGIKNESI